MRKFLTAIVAVAGLGLVGTAVHAADAEKAKEIHGVLIDNACGKSNKTEEDAAKHPASCTTKDGCAKSGYQVITGEKHLKFDDKGNDLAKKYLADKDHGTAVVVLGTPSEDGKSIMVKEIKAGKKSEKGEKSGEHEHEHDDKK